MANAQEISKTIDKGRQNRPLFFGASPGLLKWALAAAALVLIFFARTGTFSFVNYDDDQILYKNNVVLSFDIHKMLTTDAAHDYIPVTLFSYAVENSIFGLKPWIYHVDNVILHLINTLLILFLTFRVLRGHVDENLRVTLSGIIAVFFAMHPLHVESVAWVTQRKDVLSAFFYLLALLAYFRFVDFKKANGQAAKNPGKISPEIIWAFVFFILSCLSKSMSVTFPAVLVLIDFLEGRKFSRAVIIEKIPFFLVTVIFGVLHLYLHDTADLSQLPVIVESGPVGRGLNSLTFYFEKIFLPLGLVAFYSLKVVTLQWFDYVCAIVIVAALVAIARYLWPDRLGVFGLLFFVVTLSPALQVIPFGNFMAFGDHYVYLPIWGLMIMIAAAAGKVLAKLDPAKRKNVAGLASTVCVAIFIFYSSLAWTRVDVWQNSEVLWKDVIAKYPMTRDAHFNLAGAYFFEENRYEDAIPEYRETITLDPHFVYAHFNLGLLYHKEGRDDMAEALFKEALSLYADLPEAHFNLAMLYRNHGNLTQAREEVQKGLQLEPHHVAGLKLQQELEHAVH